MWTGGCVDLLGLLAFYFIFFSGRAVFLHAAFFVAEPVNGTLVVLGQFAWQMCRWPLAMPLGVCQGCGLT